jgi:long-chain fatty acid transport protein
MNTKSAAILAVALTLTSTPIAFGLGVRIIDQNAEATARANAFTATADNASAVYYNPAGLTQLKGTHILFGGYGIHLNSTADLDVGGDSFDNLYDPQAIPQIFASWTLESLPLTFGMGIYAPFGFALDWADDVPFRQFAHKGSIKYIRFNPVIAWRITDTLSIAGGVAVDYAKVELEQGVIAPGDKFRFEGDDVALGYNLGIRWQPTEKHAFGAMYQSATTMNFRGHSELRTDDLTIPFEVFPGIVVPVTIPGIESREYARTTFDFPQTIKVGYSFRPTPDWNFEVNVDWTDWDSLNTLTLKQRRSANVTLPFNWESSRHVFSVGVGRKWDRYSVALAYQHSYGPSRNIERGTVVDGNYEFRSHAVSFSLGYNF